MKNAINNDHNVRVLAVNDPHKAYGEVSAKIRNPKRYCLVSFTKAMGGEVEVLMPMTHVEDLRSLKTFFINNGHPPVNDPNYWKDFRQRFFNGSKAELKLSLAPGFVEGVYLCGNDDVIGDRSRYVRLHPGARFRPSTLSSKGSLEDWKNQVASLALYSDRLMLALCTALSGLIVEWAGIESGGFHMHGTSSDGKTTATKFACTVYGDDRYLLSWDMTEAAIEEAAVGMNDALLPLNELKLLNADPVVAAQKGSKLVYLIAEGSGRHRASSYQEYHSQWKTAVLSSGELSLQEHAASGHSKRLDGETVRVIDIPSDAGSGFGILDKIPKRFSTASKFAEHISDQCTKYHGTAFKPFVEGILALSESGTGSVQKKINGYVDTFIDKCGVDRNDRQEMRIARRFGVTFAAGAMAIEFGVLDFKHSEVGKAIRNCYQSYLRAKPKTALQRIDEACAAVFDRVTKAELLDVTDSKRRYTREDVGRVHGFKTRFNGELVYAIKSRSLKNWVDSQVKFAEVMAKFKSDHVLMLSSDGKSTRQVKTGFDEMPRMRCYCFRTDTLNS